MRSFASEKNHRDRLGIYVECHTIPNCVSDQEQLAISTSQGTPVAPITTSSEALTQRLVPNQPAWIRLPGFAYQRGTKQRLDGVIEYILIYGRPGQMKFRKHSKCPSRGTARRES